MANARRSILRLLDANANRALEGVRVCEDIVRFHFEDEAQFRRLRALRHGIAQAVRALDISPVDLVAARDSRVDVGRKAPAADIKTLEHLLLINLQRAKEALRALEECSRLVNVRQTPAFQRLRFRTYEIERELLLKLASLRHRGRRRSRRP